MIKISIITVVKNGQKFLEETIKSVIDQDYPNIEFIIVDGNSTDNTDKIINKYKKHITTLIQEDDLGQTDALVKGLDAATGEYLCWLNYDDLYYTNQTISKVIRSIEQHPKYAIYYGNDLLIDEMGNAIIKRVFCNYTFKRILLDRSISQPSTIFSTKVYKKYGLNKSLRFSMDLDFFLSVFKSDRTKALNFIVAKNRIHADRKMSANYLEALREASHVRRSHGLNVFLVKLIYLLRLIRFKFKKI
jgi:glycosyltransferase involved in cell wall biosynthesis